MIKLDLVPSSIKPVLHASQYDDGRQWECQIFNDGTPYVFQSGDTVDYTIRKGDGLLVTGAIAVTPGTSYVILVSTEQMCAVFGSNLGELTITSNGTKVGSVNFIIEVERAPDENGITSQSEIKNLNRQITDEVDRILPDKIAEEVPQAVDDYIGDNYYDKTETDEKFATNEALEELAEEVDDFLYGEIPVSLEKQYDPAVIANNGYVTQNVELASGFTVSKPFAIPEEMQIVIIPYSFNPRSETHCVICFYTGTGLGTMVSCVAGATEAGLRVEIPESANYFRITHPDTVQFYGVNTIGLKQYALESELDEKADKTSVYTKEEIDEDLKTTEYTDVAETITPTWTAGYVSANGVVHESDSYHYSSRISVNEGDKVYFYNSNDVIIGTYRFLAAYYNNAVVEAKGGQNISDPYIVPNGVDEIVVSIANMSDVSYGKKVHQESELVPALKPDVDALLLVSANAKDNSLFYEFDYTAGTTFSGTENLEDISGYRVCFFAKIGAITGEARIGKGIGFQYGGGIGFDGTNLYLYMGTNQSPQGTKAHGLTLKDYVAITIDAKYNVEAKVTISTNGGRYEWNLSIWRSNYGKLTFTAPDNYNECKLSYTCEGLTKETWLYGDSYFSNSDDKRWTKYLILSGHTNYLLNAYGGRTSINALASLKVDLSMNRSPRRIVWCLGMNDKDSASAPNQGWQNSVEEVMQICEKLHIELVLATIPNVPHQNADNTKKNAYVVASGYRYIDFAIAVSLNGDSTWYDNMLYSDNMHPDVQGAIALYGQAVATVPELLF